MEINDCVKKKPNHGDLSFAGAGSSCRRDDKTVQTSRPLTRMMGGGRKRSRRLALLAPLLVVVARGDGSVELLGDHISQEKNQPTSYRNGTYCVDFSWKQTADAVNFGSPAGTASTCQPSAFDIQATPCEYHCFVIYCIFLKHNCTRTIK